MKADLVFEGGGVKGIAFVGAICCLEELGYEWQKLAGTSAGSIVASLLSVGYSGKELKEIIMNLDYKKFLDKDKLQSIPLVGRTLGLVQHKGLYCGEYIEKWLNDLFKQKGKTKFKHISNNGQSRLKVIASDITKREIMILPDDISKYGYDPMELEIASAVRMSISIPMYFNPVKLEYNKGKSFVVDGGILSNYPIWIFDTNGKPRWPTFGFKLEDSSQSYSAEGKDNLIAYLIDVVNTILERNEEIYIMDKHSVRNVNIPTLGVKTTQFNITKEESLALYQSGYKSARNFIQNWNFQEYIKKYR